MKTALRLAFVGIGLAAQGTFGVLSASPPSITPASTIQSNCVWFGQPASFRVQATGEAPLSYQWRRNGQDLPGQTNWLLSIPSVRREDEGDYTVTVNSPAGSAATPMVRIYVIPPLSELKREDFTNRAAARLPYYYMVPENYDAARRYALVMVLHGAAADERNLLAILAEWPGLLVFGSYGQQARDPAILVLPTRRVSEDLWTNQHLLQVSKLLDHLMAEFNVDTNRVYLVGGSAGVWGAWDLLGLRPDCFAAAVMIAGGRSAARTSLIKHVPFWVFCAADDDVVGVGVARAMVDELRRAGGNVIYSEYDSGGHVEGCKRAFSDPAMVDWVLAQRRGVPPAAEPMLLITTPTTEATWTTGATNVNLAGSAVALGESVIDITWANYTNGESGHTSGTHAWSLTGVPLSADRTNIVAVTARTTCFTPFQGGYTTFNDTLTVVSSPIRATLHLKATGAALNWSGGGAPFRVQETSALGGETWIDMVTNGVPPLGISLDQPLGFYRIVGH